MTVFIDADGCPVVDIAVGITKKAGIDCVIVCDTAQFTRSHTTMDLLTKKRRTWSP